ncbi:MULTISPECIES: ABC transporter permease [Petrotoga]|uniref:Peptide/nickel transport system permease protein n=1 Tax=Petrotoga sibirica TaxID=156202 RepID=A0A4R8EV36_9BACT|nr:MULTISPECIES: ABC transporter permease [Petrotoga]TDX16289.1 peptide/nickel transport system permease protein [Petrotoga sibirica]
MKKGFLNYFLPRIIQYFIVIFIGVTVAFIIPKLSPVDPVESVLNKMSGYSVMNPEAVTEMRETLQSMFGTEKKIFIQYVEFWGRILKGDFGPSLTMFPVPVMDVIMTSLPWSMFLLLTAVFIAWLLGIILGTIIGLNSQKIWTKFLEGFVTFLYPIPHYIVALLLLFLFSYLFPIFPLTGTYGIGSTPQFSLSFLGEVVKHSFLPALSIVLVSLGWRALSQKSLVSNLLSSDFMRYAKIGGVPKQTRFFLFDF